MSNPFQRPVRRAIELLGGVRKAAKTLGVSPTAIYKWLDNGVTAERAIEIERATNGEVKREELRPDLYRTDACEVANA